MRQFTSDDTSRWGEGFGDGSSVPFDTSGTHHFTPTSRLQNGAIEYFLGFNPGDLVVIENGKTWELNKIKAGETQPDFTYPLELADGTITVARQYEDLKLNQRVGSNGTMAVFCTGTCVLGNLLEVPGSLYVFAHTIHIPGKLVVTGRIVLCGQVIALDNKIPWEGDKEVTLRYSTVLSIPSELTAVADKIYV